MEVRLGINVIDPEAAVAAERAGFDSVWVVDHFYQFSHRMTSLAPQINIMCLASLPAILSRTERVAAGVSVICPLFRYHPAVIAQYFAQLDCLFPNRVILGLGTGEAVNEVPIVGYWPPYKERRDRLIEAVEIIRRLWTSRDYFNYEGKYYRLKDAFLYLKPEGEVPLVISATGPRSARMAGRLGDGLMVLGNVSPQAVAEEILPGFIQGAEEAGKEPETLPKLLWTIGGLAAEPLKAGEVLKPSISFADRKILNECDPRKIDELAKDIPTETILEAFPIVATVDELIAHFEAYIKAGLNEIVFYDLTPATIRLGLAPAGAEERWERMLPYFREKYGDP